MRARARTHTHTHTHTQSFSDFTEQLWLSLDLRVPRQAELEEGKDLPVKSHLLGQDFTFSRFQHGNTYTKLV